MIKPSIIADSIQLSLVRSLFNEAKKYDDVIDFTLGDPDVATHQAIKDAASAAIQQGKTRYSQNAGLLDLRQTISKYYELKEGDILLIEESEPHRISNIGTEIVVIAWSCAPHA